MSTIFEDDANDLVLPFEFSVEDQLLQKQWNLNYLKDVSMVSTFGDIDELGVKFDLEKDFVPQSKEAAENAEAESPLIKEYFKSKEHGGNMLQCYPLSYVQANMTYCHVAGMELQELKGKK